MQGSGRTETHFHFELIDVPVVNAFASPGGMVVVFSELMLTAETENELAGVLAHEIAHVTQRHIARRMESSFEDMLRILLGAVALAVATQGQGDGAQAALAGGMALMQQRQINFTRENEHEADRVGIQTLSKAGFDPSGMAGFFARIGNLHRTQGEKPPEYLQTHPVTSTRIAKARADKLREPGSHATSLEFELMRERLRVLTARDLPALVRYYQDSQRESELDEHALAYGLALAQSRIGDYRNAQSALQKLSDEDPQRLSYQLALAEAERNKHDFDAADRRYQRLLDERPGHRVISIAYARSQIERDTARSPGRVAVEVLRPMMSRFSDDPSLQEPVAPISSPVRKCAPLKPMPRRLSCAANMKMRCASWSRPRNATTSIITNARASTLGGAVAASRAARAPPRRSRGTLLRATAVARTAAIASTLTVHAVRH